MNKCISFEEFVGYLFDDEQTQRKASKIIRAIMEAQSPRISNISAKMAGRSESEYKAIQRFLEEVELKRVLMRLYQETAAFVIGDPTEMPRHKAPKTDYVGTLSDGVTPGYWLLVLSTPFRGRAIPFHFVIYSSKTIETQATSRNQEHFKCFEEVKKLLGDRPLVLDREFSYEELIANLSYEQVEFVIRLNYGNALKPVGFTNAQGQPVRLMVGQEKTVIYRDINYLGRVKVNVIGFWRKGLSKPLWVMTSLDPEKGLEIYLQRMKIELTFRDCKDLLHLPKLMNKKQHHLEQMIALTLITFVIGLWVGEALRDMVYANVVPKMIGQSFPSLSDVDLEHSPKWYRYSGLFILLKQKLNLSLVQFRAVLKAAASTFAQLVFPPVRSFV